MADFSPPPSAPSSGNVPLAALAAAASGEGDQSTTPTSKPMNKAAAQMAQMNKMRDANNKYKNLLKMAKERIQQQEEELEQLRRKWHTHLVLYMYCFLSFVRAYFGMPSTLISCIFLNFLCIYRRLARRQRSNGARTERGCRKHHHG